MKATRTSFEVLMIFMRQEVNPKGVSGYCPIKIYPLFAAALQPSHAAINIAL